MSNLKLSTRAIKPNIKKKRNTKYLAGTPCHADSLPDSCLAGISDKEKFHWQDEHDRPNLLIRVWLHDRHRYNRLARFQGKAVAPGRQRSNADDIGGEPMKQAYPFKQRQQREKSG
ncbi:hypothetical protein AB0305_00685 [Arthrobacter sp. NPDC080086]|uniref:hypothetical protein n=1 Tax=Arthrobacter sp. NPDC080086 TaxID=3155917 RepID=UPI00344F13B4